ncbi:MAG: PDZ domain-containing protein, partial [Actinobacteria bacterium]|nr:PDZ domain-containing protein [Actinomycetota bacterium]
PASFTGNGATVLGLSEHGPASGKIRVGDVITSVDGHAIALPADIQVALRGKAPGDVVPVVLSRSVDGRTETVDVTITLGSAPVADDSGATTTTTAPSNPAAPPSAGTPEPPAAVRPILGVSVEPDQPRVDSPVHVAIDSGDVTGPSAGLAWALAVVDRLTPESLTGGKDVAVTGEILPDGSVGPIGGIAQKVAAVKRAGVTTFLYPASTDPADVRQMKAVAGKDVRVIPVATLAEAVEALHRGPLTKGG